MPKSKIEYPVLLRKLTPAEGGGYLAEFPDLPACLADGATPEARIPPKPLIPANHRHPFTHRRRDNHPVERIAMVPNPFRTPSPSPPLKFTIPNLQHFSSSAISIT